MIELRQKYQSYKCVSKDSTHLLKGFSISFTEHKARPNNMLYISLKQTSNLEWLEIFNEQRCDITVFLSLNIYQSNEKAKVYDFNF